MTAQTNGSNAHQVGRLRYCARAITALLCAAILVASARTAQAGINVWTSDGPPGGGGSILAVVIDPNECRTVYAGTANGGVFKSIDSGRTWSAVNVGLTHPALVLSLAIDPTTSSTLYAGTRSGVFKSADGGGTWTAATAGPENVYALAVDPNAPTTLYAGNGSFQTGGVFKSTADAPGWSASLTGTDVDALAISPVNAGTLYAGTLQQGVFKSTDAGGTWQSTGLSVPVVSLVVDPVTSATIYGASPSRS